MTHDAVLFVLWQGLLEQLSGVEHMAHQLTWAQGVILIACAEVAHDDGLTYGAADD